MFKFVAYLLVLFCTPEAIVYFFNNPSATPGLLLTFFLTWLYFFKQTKLLLYGNSFIIITVLLIAHSIISNVLFGTVLERSWFGILFTLFMLCTCSMIVTIFRYESDKVVDSSLRFVFWCFVAIGWIGVVMSFLGVTEKKEVVIFSEPSAYAVTFAPLIFYYTLITQKTTKYYLAMLFLLPISILLQNMTMLIVLTMAFILTLRKSQWIIVFPLMVISVLSFMSETESEYFLSRLDFSHTANLSALVYMSGWERMYLNFVDTLGFGLGFHNFGVIGAKGHYLMLSGGLNVLDGSFIASKFISELGVISVFLLIVYLYKMFILIIYYKLGKVTSFSSIFFLACYISFLVPLLVRGSGYFNVSVELLISSIIFFSTSKYIYSEGDHEEG